MTKKLKLNLLSALAMLLFLILPIGVTSMLSNFEMNIIPASAGLMGQWLNGILFMVLTAAILMWFGIIFCVIRTAISDLLDCFDWFN